MSKQKPRSQKRLQASGSEQHGKEPPQNAHAQLDPSSKKRLRMLFKVTSSFQKSSGLSTRF